MNIKSLKIEICLLFKYNITFWIFYIFFIYIFIYIFIFKSSLKCLQFMYHCFKQFFEIYFHDSSNIQIMILHATIVDFSGFLSKNFPRIHLVLPIFSVVDQLCDFLWKKLCEVLLAIDCYVSTESYRSRVTFHVDHTQYREFVSGLLNIMAF